MYANAVSRDLACANTGASTPRSPPSSLSSQARSSTMTPAAIPMFGLVTKHEHGMAATRIKRQTRPGTPGSPGRQVTNPDCSTRLTGQSRPVAGPDLLAYVHACWLFALIGINMAVTCTQRKQRATSPLPDYRVWQAGVGVCPAKYRRPLPELDGPCRFWLELVPSGPVWRAEPHPGVWL